MKESDIAFPDKVDRSVPYPSGVHPRIPALRVDLGIGILRKTRR
jgi:hypothetical protein